jgi:F-type H+-transporting ATPase subunit b
MLIDWFTVGAQALNFLLLVWLMKRFLYKPILHAIDEREKRIAAELADADAKKAEAKKEQDDFQRKNEEFDQQRSALLSKAKDEANGERQRLLDEARKAADVLSAKRQELLRNDARNLNHSIRRRAEQEIFAIARKALADLATTSLEERMGDVFNRRLRGMDGERKKRLAEALKTASDPALVRSAFDLPAEQRAAIQNALNETFSAEIRVRFEAAPNLVSGIELTTNGQKVAWSIADYLVSLEEAVGELLKEQDQREDRAKAPDEVTAKIAKRAYELYEHHSHESDSANQDWSQAEREIRNVGGKREPNPEVKAESASEPKAESKPDVKVKPKPAGNAGREVQADPNANVESGAKGE